MMCCAGKIGKPDIPLLDEQTHLDKSLKLE